jgi:hypothetical protein
MTISGEDLFNLFQSRRMLRKELCCLAWRFARNPRVYEEMLLTAWLAIGSAPAEETDLYYYTLAYHVCERLYQLKYRYTPKVIESTERSKKHRRLRFFVRKYICMAPTQET